MDIINRNPFNWGSEPYFLLIAAALILRRMLPASPNWRYRLVDEMLVIIPAVLLYFLVRGLVDARADTASENALRVINLEQRLGLFREVQLQAAVLRSDLTINLANWVYIWAHWPVIALVVTWLVLLHHDAYPRYRNVLLLSGAFGMLIFAWFPVAPPRLMADMTFVDTVTQRSHAYRILQPPSMTNPFAAMPSLHFGWNLLMGIAIFEQSRRTGIRYLALAMPVAMYLAIVVTANHYILDGIVGGVIVLGTLAIVSRFGRAETTPEGIVQRSGDTPSSNGHRPLENAVLASHRPLAIAHRYGNSLATLRQAEARGADVVEADVWLHRGRLEVRHSKTFGPIPILWDRWSIQRGDHPRFQLNDLLQATLPDTMLMLDIKGRDPRIATLVIAALRTHRPGLPVVVCSQNWPLLESFRAYHEATLVHSIGNRSQLRDAWKHLAESGYDAVSIQFRLLDEATVTRLRGRVSLIFSWPVNAPARFQQAVDWRLDGVIVDDLSMLTTPVNTVRPSSRVN